MVALEDGPQIHNSTVNSIADFVGQWYVGHAKSRQEKAWAEEANARGINFFLPMTRVTSGVNKRLVDMPIFPSYVFFCGDADDRYEALATNRLCQVIPVIQQGRLRRELLDLERTIVAGFVIDRTPFAVVGSRVRVFKGPLQGVIGTVIQREDGAARLVLSVNMIGAAASLEIDADLLEPCDN